MNPKEENKSSRWNRGGNRTKRGAHGLSAVFRANNNYSNSASKPAPTPASTSANAPVASTAVSATAGIKVNNFA